MAEDSYIDVARQRRTVNKLKALIDQKADSGDWPVAKMAETVYVSDSNNYEATTTISQAEYDKIVKYWPHVLLCDDRGRSVSYPEYHDERETSYRFSCVTSLQITAGSIPQRLVYFVEKDLSVYVTGTPVPYAGEFSAGFVVPDNHFFTITNSFGSMTLKDSAITTAKLADGSVTKAKLGSDVVIPDAYTLPAATASTLGGVKVGDGLSVTDDGTLSAESIVVLKITDNKVDIASVKKYWPNVVLTDDYHFVYYAGSTDSGHYFFRSLPELVQKYNSSSGNSGASFLLRGYSVNALGTCTYIGDMTARIATTYSAGVVKPSADFFTVSADGTMLLKDSGITSAKLADGAVTAGKIADGAITADKLASGVSWRYTTFTSGTYGKWVISSLPQTRALTGRYCDNALEFFNTVNPYSGSGQASFTVSRTDYVDFKFNGRLGSTTSELLPCVCMPASGGAATATPYLSVKRTGGDGTSVNAGYYTVNKNPIDDDSIDAQWFFPSFVFSL